MADESQGWVKLWRSIRDNPRRKDPDWLAVWVDFLTGATHRPFESAFDGKIITLRPGQIITGRHAQAKRTGVHESKVRRVWAVMKSDQQISQLKGVTSSLFTILNWSDYQTDDQPIDHPNGQRSANDRPTTDHKQEQKKDIDTYAPVEPPAGFPKSEDEAIRHAMHVGAEPEFIRMVWNKAMSRGGNDAKDVPIRKWSNYIAIEWKYERTRREKDRNANNRTTNQQRPNRNAGTANEGDGSEYRNVGKVA